MAAPIFSKSVWQAFVIMNTIIVTVISANFFKDSNKNFVSIPLDEFPVTGGNIITVKAPENGQQKLCVLCYPGQEKKWYRVWTNPKLMVDGEDYLVFHGDNETMVMDNSQSNIYLQWPSLPFVNDQFAFKPFNASCIGIASQQNYTVTFTVKNPELFHVGLAAVGFLFFFCAASWSRSVALHYSFGVSLGVLGSVLIFMIIAMKFVPQKLKTLTTVAMVVSTSVSMYLYKHISTYCNDILINNWKIVCGYVLISGLVSFAVVYRYGPVTNPRSLDLVKWTLHIFGLVLVFHSSQIPELSIAIILVVLVAYHIPHRIQPQLTLFRYRYFPPTRQLLTEEEYQAMADVETKKALEELRYHCRSPECNTWKTISHLTSPIKFAQFMEGDSHISDSEFECHFDESEINVLEEPSDDSSSEESDVVSSMISVNGKRF